MGQPGDVNVNEILLRLFARAGHEVVFSYARSAQKLKRLAREAQRRVEEGFIP